MKPSEQSHMHMAGISHPGEQRSNNEDCYRLSPYMLPDHTPAVLAVVSDGIGGHKAGEVASEITVETIFEALESSDGQTPLQDMGQAVLTAGQSVVSAAAMDSNFEGMGSTVAIAWVIGERLYTATVGDSRIYLLRNGKIRQISIDHTWLQGALDQNILSAEEAEGHPYGHVLQRAIGSPQPPAADFRLRMQANEGDQKAQANQGLKLHAGDQVLLCSDGLTDLVRDDELQTALVEQSPEDAAQSLVSLARARGGHDNITMVILSHTKTATTQPPRKRRVLPYALIALLLILLGLLVAAILVWRIDVLDWFGFLAGM